jgi:hypothetical protein
MFTLIGRADRSKRLNLRIKRGILGAKIGLTLFELLASNQRSLTPIIFNRDLA